MKYKLLFQVLCSLLFTLYPLRPVLAGAEKYYGKFYSDGPAAKSEFALTYDDGPGFITGDLLKLLDKYGAKATFFMMGGAVRKYPEKAAAVSAAGHLIGNHTDTHANYYVVGRKDHFLEKELDAAFASIQKAIGKKPEFLRMPNGYNKAWVREVAAKKGYILVNWTYGSDWTKKDESAMTAEYLKNVRPGAILLMHDGGGKAREKTLRITEAILQEARRRGLKAVRVDELLGIPEVK